MNTRDEALYFFKSEDNTKAATSKEIKCPVGNVLWEKMRLEVIPTETFNNASKLILKTVNKSGTKVSILDTGDVTLTKGTPWRRTIDGDVIKNDTEKLELEIVKSAGTSTAGKMEAYILVVQ